MKNIPNQSFKEEENIDFHKYLFLIIKHWYWFAIAMIAGLIISHYYNRSKKPVYEIKSTIIIDPQDASTKLSQSVIQSELLNESSSNDQRLNNEKILLKSFPLTYNTLKRLNFQISYFFKDIYYKHIYPSQQCFFQIQYDTSHVQPVNLLFHIKHLEKDKYLLTAEEKNVSLFDFETQQTNITLPSINIKDTLTANQMHKTKWYHLGIYISKEYLNNKHLHNQMYAFKLNTLDHLTIQYLSCLKISIIENSSALELSFQSDHIQKSVDFLNNLIDTYIQHNLDYKNKASSNTIDFINDHLKIIGDSLQSSKEELQLFRSENQLINMDMKSQEQHDELFSLQSDKAQKYMELRYYQYLKKYLSRDSILDGIVVPSSVGLKDQILSNLLNKLTGLYAEHSDWMVNSKKNNPLLKEYNHRVNDLKKTIFRNIESNINTLKMSIKQLDQRIEKNTKQFRHLPFAEQRLFAFERKFDLYDVIYTFLLKKRTEMRMIKASNLPEIQIVNQARPQGATKIAPNIKRNYILGGLAGILIPMLIIVLKDYFNEEIISEKDVVANTIFPILGHVLHYPGKHENVVKDDPHDLISENFRSIWANFQFIGGQASKQIILITSSVEKEGKSFISTNIASTIANYRKKTILLYFDLRKNVMSNQSTKGLTHYLSDNCDKMEDIITHTDTEYLDIIFPGAVPPNPSGLINSSKTGILINELKQRYDHIIIDTSPIGIISDALHLSKYAGNIFLIARHNYTPLELFKKVSESFQQKDFSNVFVIVNDIHKTKSHSYGYGYYYGKGYYYNKKNGNNKKTRLKIFFNIAIKNLS